MFNSHARVVVASLTVAILVTAFAVVLTFTSTPESANATPNTSHESGARLAPQDGSCDIGDVCLWYGDNFTGSAYDTPHNEPSLANNHFNTLNFGFGEHVDNNTRAVQNRDQNATVRLCTGTQYSGSCTLVLPNSASNLSPVFKDNIESLIWLDSSN